MKTGRRRHVRGLLLRLRRRWRSETCALTALPLHYRLENIAAHANCGRLLRWTSVLLLRRVHGALASPVFELTTENRDFFFILYFQAMRRLLHLVDSVPYHLHLLQLLPKLMLIVLGLPHLRLEFDAYLLEQFIEASTSTIGRGCAPHAAVAGIHRHIVGFVSTRQPERTTRMVSD